MSEYGITKAQAQEVAVVADPVASRVDPAQSRIMLARFWRSLDVFPATVRTYEHNMARYLSWLEDAYGMTALDVINAPEVLHAYKAHMLEEGKKPSTVQTYLIPVKRFYRWFSEKYAAPNPASDLRSPRSANTHSRTALSTEAAKKTVAQAKAKADESLAAARDYAIYMLLIGCGLRTIEVVRADAGDVFTAADGVPVLEVQGKGHSSKDDEVVLPAPVLAALEAYMEKRGPVADDEPLFCGLGNRSRGERLTTRTVSRIAKETMRAAGYDNARLTAHSLRHTAVTMALLNGATAQEAQRLARHKKVETTMRYAHNLKAHENPAINAAVAYLEV